MKNNILPVVFLTDDNYTIPTAAAIQSLIFNNMDNDICIYIIAKDVKSENLECFKQFEKDNVHIHILDVKRIGLDKFNENGYYVSSTALLKFDIADLIPEFDKVLYIDGDVLVLHDLMGLYNIDISEYCVAAVPDMAAIDACHFDEHLPIRNYFNSGVMLLNTKLIRERNLKDELYDIKRKHPEYMCMDQDVFNDGFKNQVLFLPPKYNLMFYNFIVGKFSLERVNEFYNTDYCSYDEMEKDAWIVHLTNEKKPWKYSDAYKVDEWLKYYKMTPFYNSGKMVMYEMPDMNSPEPIIIKKGIFYKKSLPEKTLLYLWKIPLVGKYREGTITTLRVGQVPIARKIVNGFTIKYYFGGICIKKIIDSNYCIHRLNVYEEILEMAIRQLGKRENVSVKEMNENEIGSEEEQIKLYTQIKRLHELRENYEDGQNEIII